MTKLGTRGRINPNDIVANKIERFIPRNKRIKTRTQRNSKVNLLENSPWKNLGAVEQEIIKANELMASPNYTRELMTRK